MGCCLQGSTTFEYSQKRRNKYILNPENIYSMEKTYTVDGKEIKSFITGEQKFTEIIKNTDDGSAIFKDAVLFAEGIWTNSGGETRKFTAEELAKTIEMWDGQDLWHNHGDFFSGGHKPGDHIGEYTNPRMVNGKVTVDLTAHGLTEASRNAINMWEAEKMKDLSAELTYDDKEVPGDVTEGINVIPYATAWVTKGACTVCKINHNKGGPQMVDEKEFSAMRAELEETKLKVVELADCKDAAAKNFAAVETKTKEFMDAKETELKELKEQIETFKAELNTIKESPVIKGIYSGNEQEKPELVSIFKKTNSGDLELKGF